MRQLQSCHFGVLRMLFTCMNKDFVHRVLGVRARFGMLEVCGFRVVVLMLFCVCR